LWEKKVDPSAEAFLPTAIAKQEPSPVSQQELLLDSVAGGATAMAGKEVTTKLKTKATASVSVRNPLSTPFFNIAILLLYKSLFPIF